MNLNDQSILIIHAAALGDTILLWPLLRGCSNPQLATHSSLAKLTQQHLPHVKTINADTLHFTQLFSNALPPQTTDALRALTNQPHQPQHIISFLSTGRDTWATNAKTIWPTSNFHFLSTKPNQSDSQTSNPQHITQLWQSQLSQQNLNIPLVKPPPIENHAGPILIHPGSGAIQKCWGFPQFETLITALQNASQKIKIILGQAELERFPDYCQSWSLKYNVIKPQTLDQLSKTIQSASLYVGNDAGPTHLAAALGIPTIALFGPTNHQIWQPLSHNTHVIHPPNPRDINWLDVNIVIDAAMNHISKKP